MEKDFFYECGKKFPALHQCKFCNFKSELLVFIKQHFRDTHRHENLENFKILGKILHKNVCMTCNYGTRSSLHWLRHATKNCKIKNIKRRFKEIVADGKGFKQSLGEEGTAVTWYLCPLCGYKSKFSHSCKQHILVRHSSLEAAYKFKCDECCYSAEQNGVLDKHILTQHLLPIRWFKCDQCTYKSKHRNCLEFHRRKHETVIIFDCNQCSFETNRLSSLTLHVKAKHPQSYLASDYKSKTEKT